MNNSLKIAINLFNLGKDDAALVMLNRGVMSDPHNSVLYCIRGLILARKKQFSWAIANFDRAIELSPKFKDAHFNRAVALKSIGKWSAAIQSFDDAIRISPLQANAFLYKGNCLKELNQLTLAIECYDRVIEIEPNSLEAFFNKGSLLKELSQGAKARQCLLQAIQISPNFNLPRWVYAFSYLLPLYVSESEEAESRVRFDQELNTLDQWFSGEKVNEAFDVVGSSQPFYFAYQERNNKEILSKYGALCDRLMEHFQISNHLKSSELRKHGKIQVGIVGDKIKSHSVWNAITKGILTNLDKKFFDVHVFYLGNIRDDETELAFRSATSFINQNLALLDWSREILKKHIEVLIYPEIGMHALTCQLANLRLAPLQMVSWGHPETSGLPKIDYFISAELFEDVNSNNNYSERLLCLPNLGCNYNKTPIKYSKVDLRRFSIRENSPILICPGIFFKYSPQNDWIFVEIARRLKSCQFVFFVQKELWLAIFQKRLKDAFSKANLNFEDFIVFLPWLNKKDFHGLLRLSDVFLDTLGFSGFNTAIQAIECEVAVVTKRGKFLRGRLASGILERLGINELVARTDNEYIDLVVRLVLDKKFKSSIITKMKNRGHLLYDDPEPIQALQNFLLTYCRGKALE